MNAIRANGRPSISSLPILLLALVLVLSNHSTAQEEAPLARESMVQQLCERIDAFAEWCRTERLLGARDEAFGMLLHFDPDHEDGRRVLKFKKKKGVWEQSASYKPRKNRSDDKLEECDERRRAVIEPYRAWVIERLGELSDSTRQAEREVLVADLMAIAPDDAESRALLGQGWHPILERWMPIDAVRSLERRAELVAQARALLDEVEARKAQFVTLEAQLEVPWTAVFETDHARVLGTGAPAEIERNARYAEAAIRLFMESVRCPHEIRPVVIYLLDERADRDAFLRSHPKLEGESISDVDHRTGLWVSNTNHVALWGYPGVDRRQRVVEQSVSWALSASFRVGEEQGWARDGLRMYVTSLLLGRDSRLQDYAGTGWSGQEARGPDVTADGGWADVVDVVIGNGQSSLGNLMSLSAQRMGSKERLCSYALARYLLECHSEEAYFVLRQIGPSSSSRAESVLAQAAGETPLELSERFVDWARGMSPDGELAQAESRMLESVDE